ncbi:MAG: hypothetical protein FJY98_00910 [Candidatus Liptonbacteria bacterium]|nr:hypothetical protein [Candidatus Liptonbacteria bacterium]
MKRLLYLLIFLVVLGLIIGAFFYFRYESPTPLPEPAPGTDLPLAPASRTTPASTTPTTPAISPVLPPPQTGPVKLLYTNPVWDFAVKPDGGIIALEPDGKIVEVRVGGVSTLSPTPISNLRKSTFAPDSLRLLTLFGGGETGFEAGLFDIRTKTWQSLPLQILDAAWSPTDTRIAYLAEKGGVLTLGTIDVADPRAKPQELFKSRLKNLILTWPSPNQILLWERPSGLVPSSAWAFDIKTRLLSQFALDQYGLTMNWGKGSVTQGLAFTVDKFGKNGSLFLLSLKGEIEEELSFLTLPEKCAMSNLRPTATTTLRTLVCAVPNDSLDWKTAMLPDSYFKGAVLTSDKLYKINLADGTTQILPTPDSPLDGTRLYFSNSTLYFKNRHDNRLYSIPLK